MNTFKKIYCRIFQTCFRIALPFLPYREPELIDGFKNVPAVLKKHHISHILLVTDPGVYKLGLTKPLEKQLSKSQISCTIYKDTVANPTSANVEDAKDLYLDHECQALLAFGGGSSMDCAKAVGARHHMLRASYLAGTAFTKSYVGYVHAVAHSLGGCYGIPHGLANSVLLPVILEAYGTAAHKKLARLARLTGISDSDLDAVAAGEFIRHIRNMNLSMNIPETLDGIRNEDIPKLARYADKEANPLYPVPVLWGPSKLEQMYHLVQEVNENDRSRNSEHPGKAA